MADKIIVKGSGTRYEARLFVGNGSTAYYGASGQEALDALRKAVDTGGVEVRYQTADLLRPSRNVPFVPLTDDDIAELFKPGWQDMAGLVFIVVGIVAFGFLLMVAESMQ